MPSPEVLAAQMKEPVTGCGPGKSRSLCDAGAGECGQDIANRAHCFPMASHPIADLASHPRRFSLSFSFSVCLS